MMEVYRVVISILNFDELSGEDIRDTIENTKFPNRCISPTVEEIESREVDWSDDHPLNNTELAADAFRNLFEPQPSPPPPGWRGISERLYRIVVTAAPLVDDMEDEWWQEHEAAVKEYESARGTP